MKVSFVLFGVLACGGVGALVLYWQHGEAHSVSWLIAHQDVLAADLVYCREHPGFQDECLAASAAKWRIDVDAVIASIPK